MTKKIISRLLDPFVLVFSTLVWGIYAYTAISLTDQAVIQFALVIPFLFVWLVPVIYWYGQRESRSLKTLDHAVHVLCYLSMGWLNFVVILTVIRDFFLWLPQTFFPLDLSRIGGGGDYLVLGTSTLCWILGTFKATKGPILKEVEIEIQDLHPALHQFRIVQISDLHVGTTIRQNYVERVVGQTNSLDPDLVVLTGDMVDGSVTDLAPHAFPLKELHSRYGSYMCLGNHDYYSGSVAWTTFWTEETGIAVLRNEHVTIPVKAYSTSDSNSHLDALLMVAGVTDPAARIEKSLGSELPDPQKAQLNPYGAKSLEDPLSPSPKPLIPHLKIMLAHNPKLARSVMEAGFDLQLSGHTHAGQFLPWTWATWLVHSPHYAGLSQEGQMAVYVNAGTGSWGPPLRFGTTTELTLIRLVPKDPVGT